MRTIDVIINSISDYIKTKNPLVNAKEPGKVVKDIVVDSPAQEFSLAYVANDYVGSLPAVETLRSILHSDVYKAQLEEALNMTTEEVEAELTRAVDDMADTYGITRIPAAYATGQIRFYRVTAGSVNIATGTTVTTSETNPVIFEVTADIIGPVTFDSATGLYYIDGFIQAQEIGIAGNVPAATILVISPEIADATSCVNLLPTTGGLDEETDDSVLDRIKLSWKGRNLNTIAGYEKFVKSQSGVTDALVVDSTNPLMTRADFAVDVYILGKLVTVAADSIAYEGVDLVLSRQPVETITSVVGSVTYTEGVDFTFVKDAGGYAYSILGQDKIHFLPGQEPSIGEVLTISYSYDRRPSIIQDLLSKTYNDGENYVVDTDVLIKAGVEVLVEIEAHVVIFPSYEDAVVKSNVTTAVNSFFLAKLLGDDIYQSDVIAVIEAVDGVDRVEIPFQKFCRRGSTGASDITIQDYEYARLYSITYV